MYPRSSVPLALAVAGALGALACESKPSAGDTPASSASAAQATAAPHPSGAPALPAAIPKTVVDRVLNPGANPPYSGPIGKVRGIVRASGDPAPAVPEVLSKIPRGTCEDARAFYGKLFREGPNRELGDVLVAVTEYEGYLPPAGDVKQVTAQGCAFESRTIAMTFGQRLDVVNKGPETFIPLLKGGSQAAYVVAMPGGAPVNIFPPKVGQYALADQTHVYAIADVFVLKFPTFAVTGLDGTFELSGIPAGEVVVSALLPATGASESRRVKVGAGDTATVDFTLPYPAKRAAPAPSASSK
jgi:hypothetical protein